MGVRVRVPPFALLEPEARSRSAVAGGKRHRYNDRASCGNSSVEEHCLAKAGVAGSNPVSRSKAAGEVDAEAGVAEQADARDLKSFEEFLVRVRLPLPAEDTAGWSNLEARRAHNPEVAGSNPAPATSCRAA